MSASPVLQLPSDADGADTRSGTRWARERRRTLRFAVCKGVRVSVLPLLAALLSTPVGGAEPLHVFVHFHEDAPQSLDHAIAVGGTLKAEGFDVVDLRPVSLSVRQPTIRYFEPHLRNEALRFRDVLVRILRTQGVDRPRVRVQDFTFYTPKPPPQSLELWLAR